MLEQKSAAQERLLIAARERKHQAAIHRHSGGWWQAYLASILFVAALFGVEWLDLSGAGQIIAEIALVGLYYGWLAFWIWANAA